MVSAVVRATEVRELSRLMINSTCCSEGYIGERVEYNE
jgi:hypothetical protein